MMSYRIILFFIFWACLAGISPTSFAQPQTKVQHETLNALFGPRYFVSHWAQAQYVSDTVHVDYATGNRWVNFYYMPNNTSNIERVSVKTTEKFAYRACNDSQTRTYFQHPQLGALHICTYQNPRTLKHTSFIQSIQAFKGIYLKVEYRGPIGALSSLLQTIQVYEPYGETATKNRSIQRDVEIYDWLYPAKKYMAFRDLQFQMTQATVSWNNHSPGIDLTYTFEKKVSAISANAPKEYIYLNLYPSLIGNPICDKDNTMYFNHFLANYRLCLDNFSASSPLSTGKLTPIKSLSPGNSIHYQLSDESLKKMLVHLQGQPILY